MVNFLQNTRYRPPPYHVFRGRDGVPFLNSKSDVLPWSLPCCLQNHIILDHIIMRHDQSKNLDQAPIYFWNLEAQEWINDTPDSKDHGANMGPTWVLSDPDGPHVGPMNLVVGGRYTKDYDITLTEQGTTKTFTVKPLNISHTLVANKIVDHSNVVGASPVGVAPTTSSFLT